jgi:hypothetical protein
MENEDLEPFSAVLKATAVMYDKQLSDMLVALYWKSLQSLTLDQVKQGISAHIANPEHGQFIPKPADIMRAFVRKPKEALIAWSQVERAMNDQGYYSTVQFEDGVINAVIKDMGGWMKMCEADIGTPWTQKEFERRYEIYQREGISYNHPLIGFFEYDNSAKGFLDYVPAPMLITESGSAKQLQANNPVDDDDNFPKLQNLGVLIKGMD